MPRKKDSMFISFSKTFDQEYSRLVYAGIVIYSSGNTNKPMSLKKDAESNSCTEECFIRKLTADVPTFKSLIYISAIIIDQEFDQFPL